jgi:hypothetical protein
MEIGEQEKRQLQLYANDKDEILNKCRKVYEYYRVKQEQNKGKKDQNDQKK